MDDKAQTGLFHRVKKVIIGGSRNLNDPKIYHKISLTALLAWVGLGADGLSSASYGPEEAFLALGTHHFLSLFIAVATAITIFIIATSYIQIIELFPYGGGGYMVASKLLHPKVGMVSGSALLIDYALTITISVAAGVDALFSFFPLAWQIYKLPAAIFGVLLLIIMNLRGIRESVVPLVPIFVIFILTHVFIIMYSVISHLLDFGTVAEATINDMHATHQELGLWGMIFLLMKAYSMGAGTYTGIEAVSNGVPILAEPKVKTAKKTMKLMMFSLSFMVVGLIISYLFYSVSHQPGRTLNATLYKTITANWDPTIGMTFVFVILLSEALILFIAAQTGFIDGPRVLANMSADRWFPTKFSILSDRLVTQNGILLMGVSALIIMVLTNGSVKYLIVLYSINVFMTFSLSQLGMVRHWWLFRKEEKKWKWKLAVNGVGLFLTTSILFSVIIIKFHDGGWITLIITGSLVMVALLIKKHYNQTSKMLEKLDEDILPAISSSIYELEHASGEKKPTPEFNPKSKTAVVLVNGFNGLGVHTLLSVIRTFPGVFNNYVFVQAGMIDAGNFKGASEIENFKKHLKEDCERYVSFIRSNGYSAESFTAIGTDIVDLVVEMSEEISKKYPNAVYFGGQLVFPHETFFTKLLHNQIVYSVQRRLYHLGFPFVILPIRVYSV